MTVSDSKFVISINVETVVANADRVLSSAKNYHEMQEPQKGKSHLLIG